MEVKIQCSCGSRYKFDVEPVNGQVPAPLSCPDCQASWTDQANAMIAQNLGLPAPSDAPVNDVFSQPPSAAGAPPPPAVPAPAKPGLRLSSHAGAQPEPAEVVGAAEEPAAAPAPASARHMPYVPTLDPLVEQYDTGSFWRGFLGAAAGALLGGLAFYLLFAHTGVRLKLLALGIGFLAGMGARLLGKDRSKELGAIGAILSVCVIVGAQYLVAWKWFHEGESAGQEQVGGVKSEYDAQVAEAKKVIAAIPNGTDQEIRLYLAKEQADEGEKPDPKSIEQDEIQEFKTEDLPYYRNLADGTMTREAYDKEHTVVLSAEERQAEKEIGERVFKVVFLAFLLSKFNLICMAGSAGIAYKMIADA